MKNSSFDPLPWQFSILTLVVSLGFGSSLTELHTISFLISDWSKSDAKRLTVCHLDGFSGFLQRAVFGIATKERVQGGDGMEG